VLVTEIDTLAARYRQISGDELMQIAAERETLAADAAVAIDAELSLRGFSVAAAKKQAIRAERKGTRRAIGNLGFSFRGAGKHFFGVSNYHLDGVTEEFDSTLWFWMMWLPFVPLASYHIQRHARGKSLWWSLSKQPFSASNEAPPFISHVTVGWAFSVVSAFAASRILLIVLHLFL